jgi:bifunctional UDP-N-acetylglucosamine pyrophosphorylase/glucosamine-1-phosphate N-acetyltransferase
MSRRFLVIPAAGLGSRLGAAAPKVLVRVAGVPMIDRLERLYRGFVSKIVLIVHPSFADTVRKHVSAWTTPVECLVQAQPTGMLDAILLASESVLSGDPDSTWITWCDQVAVHPATVDTLAGASDSQPAPALILPTVRQSNPYIHLERDGTGRIVRVLHRREGDRMPDVGESDMGLFALSRQAFLELLPQYESEVSVGHVTGERNFLPFIPWAASWHEVVTFPSVDEEEAVGINTPEELAFVERYLAKRGGAGA